MADAPPPFDLDSIAVLIDDARTEIIQAAKVITEATHTPPDPALMGALNTLLRTLDTPQEAKLQAALEDITHTLRQLRPPRRLPWYVWPASVVLAGLCGVGVGWRTVGCSYDVRVHAGLMSQVDALLTERCTTLPPAMQAAVTGLYTQLHLIPPGERKRAKK